MLLHKLGQQNPQEFFSIAKRYICTLQRERETKQAQSPLRPGPQSFVINVFPLRYLSMPHKHPNCWGKIQTAVAHVGLNSQYIALKHYAMGLTHNFFFIVIYDTEHMHA